MWFGKIAIILYVFSVATLFAGYWVNQIFQNPSLNSLTYSAIEALSTKNEIDPGINIDLVFGDFIAGLTVVFGILTGDTIASAFSIFPFVDTAVMLLIRIIFTLASAMLWVYIVANRSL